MQKIAIDMGFEIVYVDTDSLFLYNLTCNSINATSILTNKSSFTDFS